MKITVCGEEFETDEINEISITSHKVLIDTKYDFYQLKYKHETEIEEAKNFLKFKKLQKKDLLEAAMTLITTCDFFINSKTQCKLCPLKRNTGCIFNSIPIEWRY